MNAVDTTGAGDVFHGGFIYGLLQNWEVEEILRFANAVAALKCQDLGGRKGIPYLKMKNPKISLRLESQNVHPSSSMGNDH